MFNKIALSGLFFVLAIHLSNAQTTTPSAKISSYQSKVLYVGVENPIRLDLEGIKKEDVQLTANGGGVQIRTNKDGSYAATVQNFENVQVVATNKKTAKVLAETTFAVKRIPDPQPAIGTNTGGTMMLAEAKIAKGLMLLLPDYEGNQRCMVRSFSVFYTPVGQNPIQAESKNALLPATILTLFRKAKTGDQCQIAEIKAACPGDKAARSINSLAFTIK